MCNIKIYPVKVQGIGASESICEALDFFSSDEKCDTVIVARGGGSIEDLWAFNEEKTARAIFECKKPVISGVGHETDYTIADFVADLRAPTPSAAAELATPSVDILKNTIIEYKNFISIFEKNYISNLSDYLNNFSKYKLSVLTKSYIEKNENKLQSAKINLINLFNKLNNDIIKKLTSLSVSLEAMSPKRVLTRGYSILTDYEGKLIDTATMQKDDKIRIVFDKGYADCSVLEVEHEKGN